MGVTSQTTAEVHARPQAVGDLFCLAEPGRTFVEEIGLVSRKASNRAARAAAGARPWIMSLGGLGLCGSAQGDQQYADPAD